MGHSVTLGGDRLGSGNKNKIHLHGYERSTHDLSHVWRSTMSSGTLVPFLKLVALPGDTFDIDLMCEIMTHPTVGPLFASYKVQLDIFQAPMRLYQGVLHNNKLGIGLNMSQVKLPQMTMGASTLDPNAPDWDNQQINPSCIFSYLGIRGVGAKNSGSGDRDFNAIPYLAYWDIYKNYYANKQEEIGAVIHAELVANTTTVTSIKVNGNTLPQSPTMSGLVVSWGDTIEVNYTGTAPNLAEIYLNTSTDSGQLAEMVETQSDDGSKITIIVNSFNPPFVAVNWDYVSNNQPINIQPRVVTFDLNDIDNMREYLLTELGTSPVHINSASLHPYTLALDWVGGKSPYLYSQEGLALKTYQSDLFNNWLSTEWIDGPGGINEITAIDTSGGSFSLDTLQLSKKVYDMLNRIAVSGGSYDDWLTAVYDHDRITRAETPIYHGGLIKELIFQEVVSQAAASTEANQPLGTLAGKGKLSSKHKGGKVTIKVDEPSYIIGIVSLTPRVDYSQGNEWDVNLQTIDDLHKPALDEIGFQELITEQMAWWTTLVDAGGAITQKSAGKQPAWINYMTAYNKAYGNFAIQNNEMFMTLNRRYESANGDDNITDLTTYIDPSKFNFVFAQTSLDAQNFWTQIGMNITARRKMSAKVMPNL